ncbi:MAG TPA: hypothetical protein VHU17_21075 [Acidimicrobiales bacterium]|nr:hypothetical protein [Acidimicrobiales bacterium]
MPEGPRSRWRALTARSQRPELVAVTILALAPLLFFGIPGLMGHPVLFGDNQYQNLPMRILAGDQIRQGTLPVLNPYIWSGSALLGGWNAGAMYPFTFLFAILPATAAWVLNEVLVYWVAALGLYLFLRASGLRPVAGLLGAASFAFAGSMAAQLVHFGVVAGMSWVPLMLLALLQLSRRPNAPARLGWIALLGASGGMCVLAGEPRAIDEAVIIAALYVVWRTIRAGRAAIGFLVSAAIGGVLAIVFSAVQWLPGVSVVSTSQRAAGSYALFSSGSLPAKWLLLLGVPDLVGGSGSFGQPAFFAHYNLAEVTGYVGIVPIVAALALLATLRWRRPVPEWLGWIVIAVVGAVLALGGNTALGPLLSHIPLFGGQRLQSRNILVTDLALGVLLAYWVQHTIDEPVLARGQKGVEGAARRRSLPIALAVPVIVVVVIVVATAIPSQFARWMEALPNEVASASQIWPSLLPFLVIAVLVGTFLIVAPRLSRRRRVRFLSLIVGVDLVAFAVTSLIAVDGSQFWTAVPAAAPSVPTSSAADGSGSGTSPAFQASVGRTGRFAIYDPLQVGGLPTIVAQPDLNIQTSQYSAQGYSAIVDATYATATGSHGANGDGTNALDPAAIGNGVLDQLDTKTLLTPSSYLITPLTTPGAPSSATAIVPPADPEAAHRTVARTGQATWLIGAPEPVTSITVPILVPSTIRISSGTGGLADATIGLVEPDGTTAWAPAELAGSSRTLSARFDGAIDAVGITVRPGVGPISFSAPTITTLSGPRYIADGQLQGPNTLSHWKFVGTDGLFTVYANQRAQAPLTLQPSAGHTLEGASVRRKTGVLLDPTSATVTSTAGAVVVRSMADIPGWTATWHPTAGGPAVDLPVRPIGIVQGVTVPPGTGTLSWSYQPKGAWLGLGLSGAGTVALLGVLAASVLRRRARRRAPS